MSTNSENQPSRLAEVTRLTSDLLLEREAEIRRLRKWLEEKSVVLRRTENERDRWRSLAVWSFSWLGVVLVATAVYVLL